MSQAGRIQCWAEQAGITPEGYDQTFHKAATAEGIAENPNTNARLIAYLQDYTGSSSTSLPELQAATALQLGVSSWNNVGYNLCGGVVPLGPELVVNGDFDTNLTGWTAFADVIWAFNAAFFNSPSNIERGTLLQEIPGIVSGQAYRLTFMINSVNGGSVAVTLGNDPITTASPGAGNSQSYSFDWTAGETGTAELVFLGSVGSLNFLDTVSLRAINP